jgi:class 3 adenylate cyclase
MEAQIRGAGGFIDSFSGDEVMALFDGSPDAAVRAGVGMWRALDEFNRRSAALGQPELQIGIGVNTGPVVLGTVGSLSRIQCTVIGDTVNLASRIEQLTKTYSARFLIGENAVRTLKDPAAFPMRLVDQVAVAGKTAPIDLYEVIDAEGPERRQAKMATAGLCNPHAKILRSGFRGGSCRVRDDGTAGSARSAPQTFRRSLRARQA